MRYLTNKFLISLIGGILFLSTSLFAAKPSISMATNAKTLGDLAKIIRTKSAKANFLIFKTDATNIGVSMDASAVGLTKEWIDKNWNIPITLFKDQEHINFLIQNKHLDATLAANYINYLLYFTLQNFPGQKFYIEDPWPGKVRIFMNTKTKKKTAKYPAVNNMGRWS